MGPGGRLVSGFDNRFRHLIKMGVARGLRVEEFGVKLLRCSGDLACRCLRKLRIAFWRVVGILPPILGMAYRTSLSERK